MKVKNTLSGNVKITLTKEQAEHVTRILNISGRQGGDDIDFKEREDTSWKLWNKLKEVSLGS